MLQHEQIIVRLVFLVGSLLHQRWIARFHRMKKTQETWENNKDKAQKTRQSSKIMELVGGFNPFEKY